MANANGRYQSRLFKFVYKQSRRFTNYADRLSSYIQNTASWVAAVGLYPIALLFQSRRSLAQQIDQAVQQNPQLSAPETDSKPLSVDTPIQRVLNSIDALSSKPAISSEQLQKPQPLEASGGRWGSWGSWGIWGRNSKSRYPTTKYGRTAVRPYQLPTTNYQSTYPVIQGIATQLTSRTLVLVTAHNEVLDILTSTQQEKLQAQILNAVADYWRYQRKQALLGRLGEKNPLHLTFGTVLAFLDRTVAKLESNRLSGVKEAIAPKPNQETPYLFSSSKKEQDLIQTSSKAIFSQDKSAAINFNGNSTRDTIRILALIRAAVDYFFGIDKKPIARTKLKSDSYKLSPNFTESELANRPGRSSNSHSQPLQIIGRDRAAKLSWAKSSQAYLSADSQSVNPSIEDPWLCESDLFGEWVATEKLSDRPQQSSSKTTWSGSRLIPSVRSTKFTLRNLVDKWGQFLFQPKPATEIVTNSVVLKNRGSTGVSPVVKTPPFFVKKNKSGGLRSLVIPEDQLLDSTQQFPLFKSLQQSTSTQFTHRNSNTDIQPSPDWIETNATVIGYVKHPLEQLLAWLDLAMLWLENILLLIWHWLRQLGARG